MKTESLEVSTWLPVSPDALYRAWLDSNAHSAFTGAEASVQPRLDGVFYAWDGYITGANLELEPGRRILQSWSTSEFPDGHPPSMLEVLLDADAGGTRITLKHTDIPEGQGDAYEQGWEEHYFVPMRTWFMDAARKPAKAPVTAKKAAPAKKKRGVKAQAAPRKAAAKKAPARKVAGKKPAAKKVATAKKPVPKKPVTKKAPARKAKAK